MSVLNNSTHKARKEHICYLCGCSIAKGETYTFRTVVDQGDFFNFRMHNNCEEIAHKFYDEMDWESHDESDFRTILKEKVKYW